MSCGFGAHFIEVSAERKRSIRSSPGNKGLLIVIFLTSVLALKENRSFRISRFLYM